MIDKSNQHSFQRLRLNLRQLEVFLATARSGSTRAAADRIARSQSAASTSLAELEAVLDEQHQVETDMADPQAYADRGLFSELSKKYHELGEAAENLLTRMGKLEEEIEALEARRAAIAEQ